MNFFKWCFKNCCKNIYLSLIRNFILLCVIFSFPAGCCIGTSFYVSIIIFICFYDVIEIETGYILFGIFFGIGTVATLVIMLGVFICFLYDDYIRITQNTNNQNFNNDITIVDISDTILSNDLTSSDFNTSSDLTSSDFNTSSDSTSSTFNTSSDSTSSTFNTSSDSTSSDYSCVICYENPKIILLYPCKHLCYCEECLIKVDKKTCPLCRTRVKYMEKIFC